MEYRSLGVRGAKAMKERCPLKNENGSVLIVALIMLVLLTLIGISATTTSEIETKIAGNERVFKRNLYFEGSLNDIDIQKMTNIMNSQLRDRTIGEVKFEDLCLPDGEAYLFLPVSKVIEIIKSCVKEELAYNRVFVHGASAVLNQPEFIDMRKVRGILDIIEDESLLAGILMKILEGDRFIIKIGSEISEEGTEDLSLVASKYEISSSSSGAVGILGPKRMDYLKVVATVNMFIRDLKEIFSKRIR